MHFSGMGLTALKGQLVRLSNGYIYIYVVFLHICIMLFAFIHLEDAFYPEQHVVQGIHLHE